MSENAEIPTFLNKKVSNKKNTTQERYYFEGFVFYAETDELMAEQTQQKVKLEPQVSQLLTLLVQNQNQVLSKEFLQQTLWPNTVVEQNSLYQVLTKLRKLLNDSSRNPKYIKTVPKKGYCFIAAVSNAAPCIERDRLTTLRFSPKVVSVVIILLLAVLFGSYLLITPAEPVKSMAKQHEAPSYQLEDVSYQLGLEFDVSVHKKHNLMAYVKDINSLHITDKQGAIIYQKSFDSRVAFPSWHPDSKHLAYWQYREDQCELFIITPQGVQHDQAPSIKCDSAIRPVWLNKDELVVTLRQAGEVKLFRYRLGTDAFVPVNLPLAAGDKAIGAVIAWHGDIYYLVKHNNQSTSLVDAQGNSVMQWDFYVWLFDYDVKNKSIISNDHSQGKTLIATQLDGSFVEIVSSIKGVFTSLSVDNQGDIYTAIEHWQVNIRNNNNHAVLSTSSIDYLANSNALGETAFVSKRSGFYEVYLNSQGKLRQLSNHHSHQFIKLLEWRPDLTLLLSSRAGELVVYDKQGELLKVSSAVSGNIKNIGWLSNDSFYAFNGKKVQRPSIYWVKYYPMRLLKDKRYIIITSSSIGCCLMRWGKN